MSLTTQLKDPESRMRRWLEVNARAMLGLARLISVQAYPRPFYPEDSKPDLAGTAFDYLFRWSVADRLEATGLVAIHGAAQLRQASVVVDVVAIGNRDRDLRPACAVVLAGFEQVARGNPPGHLPLDSLHRLSADRLIQSAHEPTVIDIHGLKAGIGPTLGSRLEQRLIQNPVFAGSTSVGGADGDWILGRTLYDCKVSWLARPIQPDYLVQLACYALLDWDDEFQLEQVALYLPRQRVVREWPLSKLFPDITAARASLRSHLGRSLS